MGQKNMVQRRKDVPVPKTKRKNSRMEIIGVPKPWPLILRRDTIPLCDETRQRVLDKREFTQGVGTQGGPVTDGGYIIKERASHVGILKRRGKRKSSDTANPVRGFDQPCGGFFKGGGGSGIKRKIKGRLLQMKYRCNYQGGKGKKRVRTTVGVREETEDARKMASAEHYGAKTLNWVGGWGKGKCCATHL